MIIISALPMAHAQTGSTGDLLYVCNGGVGNISIVDLNTNLEAASIERPSMPYGTALSPDGSRLYVTGVSSGKVFVINTSTGNITDTINAGSGPYIAMSADGSQACLMGDYGSKLGMKLTILNMSTQKVTATLPGGTRPRAATFSPDGSILYVADMGNNGIRALNISSGELISYTLSGGYPIGLSISPDGDHLYAAVISSSSMSRVYPSDCPTFTCCNPAFIVQSLVGLITGKGAPGDTDAIYQLNASDLSIESTIPLGAAPMGYVAGPEAMAFVVCDGGYGSYLYIVNTSARDVADKIPLGGKFMFSRPPFTMAVSPDGSHVLFCREYNNTITSVDMGSRAVTTINMGDLRPDGVSASLSHAYITSAYSNKVLAFDMANDTNRYTIGQWWAPKYIALSPDGSRAYVVSEIGNLVSVIDTGDNRVISDIPVVSSPRAIAISPNGSTVCVANYDSDTVSVIDTSNDTVSRTLYAGRYPSGLTFSPDGSLLYVVNQDSWKVEVNPTSMVNVTTESAPNNSLYVFDTKTGNIVGTAKIKYSPMGIAASPDGRRIYVTNGMFGNVMVMDAKNLSLIEAIKVGDNPGSILISPDGSRLYIIYSAGIMRKIMVIDTNTYTVISDSAAAKNPFLEYMALSPDGSWLYVSDGNFVDGYITAINTTNLNESRTIMAGYSHGSMAVLRH
jgi:YVTN family beta-propeller protein